MIKQLVIGMLLFLCLHNLQAQDSLGFAHRATVKERGDLSKAIRNSYYSNPAFQPFRFHHSATTLELQYFSDKKEHYNLQEGSGEDGFRIHTNSYLKQPFPNVTLWGSAQYENLRIKRVQFNETSDIDLLYPYLTSDSVGGDLRQENYQFSGGIAKEQGKWVYGTEFSYRAVQSFRRIDPRQNNVSSHIHWNSSVGYQLWKNYQLAGTIGLQYYKQENAVRFNHVLGRPSVQFLNGLGAYNELMAGFSGAYPKVYYDYVGLEGKLSFLPKNEKGLFMETSLKQGLASRILPRSPLDANQWTDQQLGAKLGYTNQSGAWNYGVHASLDLQTKIGKESLFANDGVSNGYSKISEKSTYRYYNFRYRLELLLGQEQWAIKPYAIYQQFKEQYASPFREQAVNRLSLGLQSQYFYELKNGLLGFNLTLQQQQVLNNRSTFNGVKENSGIDYLLKTNYQYLIMAPFTMAGEVRYDWKMSSQWKPFIAGQVLSASKIQQERFAVRLGMLF